MQKPVQLVFKVINANTNVNALDYAVQSRQTTDIKKSCYIFIEYNLSITSVPTSIKQR